MIPIANFCRFLKELFTHMQWNVEFKHNPHYGLNGAVYLTMVKDGEYYLVTVQPIIHKTKVVFGGSATGGSEEQQKTFEQFMKEYEDAPDGRGQLN